MFSIAALARSFHSAFCVMAGVAAVGALLSGLRSSRGLFGAQATPTYRDRHGRPTRQAEIR